VTDQFGDGELIFYRTADAAVRVEVLYESETFWLDQRRLAELFGVDRVTQALADRVKTLEERYAETLPQLEAEVEELARRVEGHLARLGVASR